VNDIKKYYSYAVYAAKAELKAEVAGSYLNWVWWILEPLCLMLVYAFIFGVVFEAREEYFTAFIYIGLATWTFFKMNVTNSVKIVKKNKSVVSKVYLPKFILVESKMFVNGFKMLISYAIVVALMIGYRVHLTWNVIYVIPLMVCLVLVTFGMMCIVCHFGVYVEDLSNVITIVLRLIFYMTGIMFSIDHRIGPKHPILATCLGKFNPMAFIISSLRSCLLYGETPARKIMLAWICIGLVLSVIGVRLIYKNENSYVKVI
jgi:ABC-type polysaccharide/polyol phosphate export permease